MFTPTQKEQKGEWKITERTIQLNHCDGMKLFKIKKNVPDELGKTINANLQSSPAGRKSTERGRGAPFASKKSH